MLILGSDNIMSFFVILVDYKEFIQLIENEAIWPGGTYCIIFPLFSINTLLTSMLEENQHYLTLSFKLFFDDYPPS
jgi:hypothetical protein